MSGAVPKPGPTQVQAAAVGEMVLDAMNGVIVRAERMGIDHDHAHALVVERMGRIFAAHSGDMFRYSEGDDE